MEFRQVQTSGLGTFAGPRVVKILGDVESDATRPDDRDAPPGIAPAAEEIRIGHNLRMLYAGDFRNARMDAGRDHHGVKLRRKFIRRGRGVEPQLHTVLGDLAPVVPQHLVELDLARDHACEIDLTANAIARLEQRHLVAPPACLRSGGEAARARSDHRDPARRLRPPVVEFGLATGAWIDQTGRAAIREDSVEARLIAGNADINLVRLPFSNLPDKVWVGQHRARHRDQIAVARGQDLFRKRRSVDAVRRDHRDSDDALRPTRRKPPGGTRCRIRDGRHSRFMPADAGVEDVGARTLDPLGEAVDLLTGRPVLHEVDRRNPVDDDEFSSRRRANAFGQLDRQAMPVRLRAAPFVGAIVGVEHGELVDQVAFRAHDLDAVEPGLPRQSGAAYVILDGLLDLGGCHRPWLKSIDARTHIGGAEALLLLRVSSGMEDLQAHFPAVLMDGVRDACKLARLRPLGENGTAGLDQPCCIRRIAAGDDEPHLAFGACREKRRHLVQSVLLHVQASVHRAHDDAIAQRRLSQLDRRQKMREACQSGIGDHSAGLLEMR